MQSVIKHLSCGSHKCTQTHVHVYKSGVCTSAHAHKWMLACTCACMYLCLCVCFFAKKKKKDREGEGEATGQQLAATSHPPPTRAQWMHHLHISAETAGVVTTQIHNLQHAATWRGARSEWERESERAKLSESNWIYVKSIFTHRNVWRGAFQRNKRTQKFNYE